MRTALLLCLLSFSAAAEDDFQTAIIVGFQQATNRKDDTFSQAPQPGVDDKDVYDYPQIVVQIGNLHFTARTPDLDGEGRYISSHPLELAVGKVVMARINERRRSLEVKIPSRGKPFVFVIERVEQIYQ